MPLGQLRAIIALQANISMKMHCLLQSVKNVILGFTPILVVKNARCVKLENTLIVKLIVLRAVQVFFKYNCGI